MPELPEVETVARTLYPALAGRSLVRVEVLNPGTWQGAVSACELDAHMPLTFAGTGRRGKVLLVFLKQTSSLIPDRGFAALRCWSGGTTAPYAALRFTSGCPAVCLPIRRGRLRRDIPVSFCIWMTEA